MAFRDSRGKTDGDSRELQDGADEPREATFIDEGCELVGELRFKNTVRIGGRVEGKIQADKTVIVSDTGTIEARIEAESVVVYGAVEGEIRAKRKITLHKNAKVTGEMQTAGIVVEEGARVRGRITIGEEDTASAPPDPGQGVPPTSDGSSFDRE